MDVIFYGTAKSDSDVFSFLKLWEWLEMQVATSRMSMDPPLLSWLISPDFSISRILYDLSCYNLIHC